MSEQGASVNSEPLAPWGWVISSARKRGVMSDSHGEFVIRCGCCSKCGTHQVQVVHPNAKPRCVGCGG